MQCPRCKLEMKVVKGYNVVTGDNSPEETTKLYRVVEHACQNKNCSQKETIRERIPLDLVTEDK